MRLSNACLGLFACLAIQTSIAVAQPAPPTLNVISRMTMVESQYGRGSTFSIDVDQREYWITAKHVLTGAKHPPYGSITSKSMSLSILDPGGQGERWLTVNFSVIDAGNDVDIVILAAPEPLLTNPLPSVSTDKSGLLLGADCEFLGFPYGGGWQARFENGQSYWMPFVKQCNVSAMPSVEPKILVLDGINNTGFSGGPVIHKTGLEQKIIAVISGYHLEPTEIVSSAATKKPHAKNSSESKKAAVQTVNVNSGFIIAYDISYAVDAIHKNPIGPLRR